MLARKISRATVLTTSALRAGVCIKNLFPCKFFKFGHTEGFLIFNITNRLNIAGRFQRNKEMIGCSRNHVQEPRIGNVSDKTQSKESMRPPGDLMQSFCGLNIHAGKHIGGDAPTDEAYPFPGSLIISYMDSQGADEKPCNDDAQDEAKRDSIISIII